MNTPVPPGPQAEIAHRGVVILVLALILLLGAGIRIWQIRESLWLDELHTAWTVAAGPGEVAPRARFGNQSPLYFQLVAVTTAILGKSELGFRFLSLVAGLALIPSVHYVVTRWSGSAVAAITAAALVALDHNAVFYSQEARPYAIVQLVGIVHVYLFWRLQQSPEPHLRLLAIGSAALLFWLHYTTGLLLLSELVWYLVLWLRGETKYRARSLVIDGLLLLVGVLPAAPHVWEVAQARASWTLFVRQRPLWHIVDWFSYDIYLILPACLVAVARMALFKASTAKRPAFSIHFKTWLMGCCWLVVPVLAAWLLTWFDVARLFLPRYLLVSAVAPIIVGSLCLASAPGPVVRSVLAGILVVAAFHGSGMLQQYLRDGRLLTDRNQDWRSAVEWVNTELKQKKAIPVLVRSGLIEADRLRQDPTKKLRQYCLSPVTSLYRLSVPPTDLIPLTTSDAGVLTVAQVQWLGSRGAAWFIINGSRHSQQRTTAEIDRSLSSNGWTSMLSHQRRFGDLVVFQLSFVAKSH